MSDTPVIPPDDAGSVTDHTMLPIDFGMVPVPPDASPLSEWEPPKHVYFGKKLPNGRLAPEPVYVHQSYPAMLFNLIDGRIRARLAANAKEYEALVAQGYRDTPAAFGMETAPGAEVVHARKMIEEKTAEVIETETVEIVKRPRGRPRKAK